jgi:hypothetical protein
LYSENIGIEKGRRIYNAPVHVGLSGEVDNRPRLMLPEQAVQQLQIANIPLYKMIAQILLNIL